MQANELMRQELGVRKTLEKQMQVELHTNKVTADLRGPPVPDPFSCLEGPPVPDPFTCAWMFLMMCSAYCVMADWHILRWSAECCDC